MYWSNIVGYLAHIYGCTFHICEQATQRCNPQADLRPCPCLPACWALPRYFEWGCYILCVIQCVAYIRSTCNMMSYYSTPTSLARRFVLKT